MEDALIKEAESSIRRSARKVDAERLRGEVRVIHWSSLKNVFENALNQLRKEVERLTAEKLALQKPKPEEMDLFKLREKAARLEKELQEALKVIAELKSEYDYLDLAEEFDLPGFEAACTEIEKKSAQVEQALARKAKPAKLPFAAELRAMAEKGRRVRDEFAELKSSMYKGLASLSLVVRMVKLSKDGDCLWQKLRVMKRDLDLLATAVA